MVAVKNISTGPRGAYNEGRLVFAEPGQVIEADDFADEWFAPDGDDDKAEKPLSRMNKAELLEVAEAEGVEIEEGATNADIVSAIELAREVKA